jgi:hypothetical protein
MRVGDIVRYDMGSTALMKIEQITIVGHLKRFYGQQCMGGLCGVYEDRCIRANMNDHFVWATHNGLDSIVGSTLEIRIPSASK